MIKESGFVVHEPEERKGKWKETFGNDRPLFVEIGMGKGRFLMDLARLHPEVNFVGIEKYSSVLLHTNQGCGETKPERSTMMIQMEMIIQDGSMTQRAGSMSQILWY